MLRASRPIFYCESLEGRALLSATAVHHHHAKAAHHHAKATHHPARATDPPIFVQISGITGESTDERHAGAIDATSFSLAASNPSSPTSPTPSSPVATPVTFEKAVDSTTPTLFNALLTGRTISQIVISVGNPNDPSRDPVRYTFSNVRISNDSISTTATATNNGFESVSFVYDTETITALTPAGLSVSQTFSFSQNRPV